MRKIFLILALLAGLAGCASTDRPDRPFRPAGNIWQAIDNGKDRFDDVQTKMVTIGDYKSNAFNGLFITTTRHTYPFVGLREGEIIFGIRSGGRFRIPVGAVQIRVDNNKAWTINPEETPLYLAPESSSSIATDGMDKKTAEAVTASMARVGKVMGKGMSPFTAATGDKAKAIIREMLNGKRIIYRGVGYNAPSTTEGEVEIDESFSRALLEIGITKEMLGKQRD